MPPYQGLAEHHQTATKYITKKKNKYHNPSAIKHKITGTIEPKLHKPCIDPRHIVTPNFTNKLGTPRLPRLNTLTHYPSTTPHTFTKSLVQPTTKQTRYKYIDSPQKNKRTSATIDDILLIQNDNWSHKLVEPPNITSFTQMKDTIPTMSLNGHRHLTWFRNILDFDQKATNAPL